MDGSKTFMDGRATLAKAVATRWDQLGLKPRMYRNSAGRNVYSSDLSALRQGDPDGRVKIGHLVALAEWLGLQCHLVAVPGAVPENVTRAKAMAKVQAPGSAVRQRRG